MSVAANTGANVALILIQQQRAVERYLAKAGALSADTAVPLPRTVAQHTVRVLAKAKIIVEPEPGLWYLDVAAARGRARQQGKAGIAVCVLLALMLVAVAVGTML